MKKIVSFTMVLFLSSLPLLASAQETKEKEVVLEEVVVTATRDWEEERKVPYNVSVITKDDIRRSNAQNVAELLRTVPGVVVKDQTANRKWMSVDIRGFGEAGPSNTLVLVDGRRVNEIDISGTDWVQIPLDQVDRIEVIRGGGSVLYGDNAVGGVVNIITKKGMGKPAAKAEAVGGSYGLNIQRASSMGALGDFRYAVHARHEDTDGFRDNGDYEGYDFGTSVGYDIGDLIKLDLAGNYHGDTYGLPGALSHQDLHTWAERDDTKFPHDKGETEDYFFRMSGELDLKEWGRIITDFSYRNRGNESELNYVDFWTGLPGVADQKSEIPTFALIPRCVWERDLWRFHNKLIGGFDYYWSDSKVKSHDSLYGDPNMGFLSENAEIDRKTWALYFHDDFSVLNNMIFSFGFRYEEIENEFKGSSYFFTWTSFRNEKDDVMDAWDVGITYLFLENSKLYGRISKSYRYPAIDEYFSVWTGLNTLLEPQEGITYEVGVDHYFTEDVRSGLTFFWMELEDEIYFDQLTFTNKNYDDTRRWGVEVFAEGQPWDWLRLWANYTYIKASFRGGVFEGNDVPDVPNHKVSFGFDLTPDFIAFLEGLEFNVWATYYSKKRFISDQPNIVPKLDDYMTVDAKLSYTWRFITAFMGVNNIFDEEYSEYGVCNPTTGARNYYPSPGVNVVGGVSLKF